MCRYNANFPLQYTAYIATLPVTWHHSLLHVVIVTAFHRLSLHEASIRYMSLHVFTFGYIVSLHRHYISLLVTTLRYLSLHVIAPLFISLHVVAFHCVALHSHSHYLSITLHCITFHCIYTFPCVSAGCQYIYNSLHAITSSLH